MALLTKQSLIDNRPERQYKTITLPPPNSVQSSESVDVRIRNMFSGEWVELINSLHDKRGEPIGWRHGHLGELTVAFCWVDENGRRVMTDDDIQATWWKRQEAGFVSAFIGAVREFSRIGVEVGHEDAKKNLPEIATDGCFCESASDSESPTPEGLPTA